MNKASISYTRNHLSRILERVRAGESILIMDRQQPVARLEPATGACGGRPEWLASLVRRGQLRPARQALDLSVLKAMPLPVPEGRGDIVAALLADREDGR